MRDRRTKYDFSQHEITVSKSDNAVIHVFKKPGTICGQVIFINAYGILAVTGDFGNWIFCREFYPSSEGAVSDHYWCEKLSIASTQEYSSFSSKDTTEEIREKIKDEEENYSEKEKEYFESLLSYVDESEERYMVYAHDNLPNSLDSESIPFRKKLKPWLECIFDAFDIMCTKLKEEELSKQP